MTNPFSFKGRIGRAELWLTLFALLPLQFLTLVIPVTGHEIVLGNKEGFSKSTINYATPVSPITAESWLLFALYCLILLNVYWIAAAAFTKRLHDRGRSGKDLVIFAGGILTLTVLQAILWRISAPALVTDIIMFGLMLPFIAVSGFVAFGLLLLPDKKPNDLTAD